MYTTMALLAGFIFIYSISSGGIKRTPFSGAIIYTTFGLIFGPLMLNILNLDVEREGLSLLAELTLALVLFTDAANADLSVLKRNYQIPQRLLLLGLPLTILFGFGGGLLLFDNLSLVEAAILATILAPTDAALGAAVISSKAVPAKIREGLNIESGLNDGICVPILLLLIALALGTTTEGSSMSIAFKLVAGVIGIGIITGIGLTLIGGYLFLQCEKRGWITESWRSLPVPALAVLCFSVAQQFGGSGFIACFTGGLLVDALVKRSQHDLFISAEGAGEGMSLLTWVVFGSIVVGQYFDLFNWTVLLYAMLSLTIIRMIPVYLSLIGLDMHTDEKLFIGWFGPRGLASIVFCVIVINEQLPGSGTITITAVCTIIMSIFMHGLSTNALISALTGRLKSYKS